MNNLLKVNLFRETDHQNLHMNKLQDFSKGSSNENISYK